MELTFEVRRKRLDQVAAEEPGDLLCLRPVEVAGLESPAQLERPLYIDLYLRVAEDKVSREAGKPAPSAPEPEPPESTAEAKKRIAEENGRKAEEQQHEQAAGPPPPAPDQQQRAAEQAQPAPEPEGAAPPRAPTEPQTEVAEDSRPTLPPPLKRPERPQPAPIPPSNSVDEFRAQVEKATAALPFLPFTPPRGAGGGGGTPLKLSKATHVEKPPRRAPRPTPENPVPEPIWEVDKAAFQKLSARKLPELKKSPEGTQPDVDSASMAIHDPNKMEALRELAKQGRKPPAPRKKEEQGQEAPAEKPKEELSPEAQARKNLEDLYDQLLAPAPADKRAPKPKTIPDELEHREEIDPTESLKTVDREGKPVEVDPSEAARVWARLLAKPPEIAVATMVDIRKSMYPLGVVQDQFPFLGIRFIPEISAALEKQYRAIAEASVGSKELLDQAVARRREELAGKVKAAQFGDDASVEDAAKKTAEKHGAAEARVEAKDAAVQKQAKKTEAALAKKKPPETASQTRDRLIVEVRGKVGIATTRFGAMEARRKSDTSRSERDIESAYKFTAQKDELRLLSTMPASADREAAVKKVTDWFELMKSENKTAHEDFRKKDAEEMSKFRGDLELKSAAAYAALRTWADQKQGVVRSEAEQKLQAERDKKDEIAEISKAQSQLDIEKLAKSANTRFQILGHAKKALTDEKKREAMLAGQDLSSEQRQITEAIFGKRKGIDDPYQMIADGIRSDSAAEKKKEYFNRLKEEIFWPLSSWRQLEAVGRAIDPGCPGVATKAHAIRNAASGYTSDDDAETMLKSLEGFNEFTIEALYRYYRSEFDMELTTDLEDDLDDDLIAKEEGQKKRAYSLIKVARNSTWKGEPQFEKASGKVRDAESGSPYAKTLGRMQAEAEALAAEVYRHGKGQWGTKEKEIFAALRSLKSVEERDALIAAYERLGYGDIRKDLEEELNDWATTEGHNAKDAQGKLTSHDAARAEALLGLDKDRADAIAIDQETFYDQWGRGDRDDVEAIYKNVEDEVRQEALRPPRKNSTWVNAEIKRRLGNITKKYDEMYKGTDLPFYVRSDPNDPNSPMVRAQRGSLTENYLKYFGKYEGDVLVKESEFDKTGADTARLMAEKKSFYVSDEESNKVLMAQQERALKDAQLDHEPVLRYYAEESMRIEEDRHFRAKGRFWTMDERYTRRQKMELAIERAIDDIANRQSALSMKALDAAYQKASGGETLAQYVVRGMSGYDAKYAAIMVEKGYLTPYQRLEFSMLGAGTNEELLKSTMKTLSKEELNKFDQQWQKDHGETLWAALDSELSGDDWIDAQVYYMGRPLSMQEAVNAARRREELSRPGALGQGAAIAFGSGDSTEMAMDAVAQLDALMRKMQSAEYANLTPEQQEGWLNQFDAGREMVAQAIETRNTIVSDVTDSVVNAVSMVVAVVVGALLSPFTGGLSALAAAAVIASLAATVTSVALRAAMLGNRYGSGQIAMDLAIGVVDAIVAALTAGMGNRLLGIRAVVNQAALKATTEAAKRGSKMAMIQLFLARLGTTGKLVRNVRAISWLEKMAAKESSRISRFVANGIAQSVENAVQSVPSAIVANVANEDNWKHGNPLGNIVMGIGQQVGMGVAHGLAFHAGMTAVGPAMARAVKFVQGPELGPRTYKTFAVEMTPQERALHLAEHQSLHPKEGLADFDARIAKETAEVDVEAAAQQKARREVIGELNQALDPALRGRFDDVPVTQLSRAEYMRVVGIGKPDVAIVVRDGQVHIVMREGANPALVREHAARIAAEIAPGTGGRVADARAALPKDIRADVPVRTDPSLPPRQVEVRYQPKFEMVIGPGATAADIRLHARTARAQLRLEGARGRVMRMVEQTRLWRAEHGTPPKGSRAYEAHFEVAKLPDVIAARQAELANPDLTPAQRAHVETQVQFLVQQLEYHQQALHAFDLEPGRGFIAAQDVNEVRVALDVHESYSRTPIDQESNLHGKIIEGRGEVKRVNQVGEVWFEEDVRGGVAARYPYRLVEGLDASGKRIAMYEETVNVNNQWQMRGSAIKGKGDVGELASKIEIQEQISTRKQAGHHDFLVDAQNASNQGFDKVRVQLEAGDVVLQKDGSMGLRKGAKPKLIIAEDKLMARVSSASITAIGDNLLKNLRAMRDLLDAGMGTEPKSKGGLGLTPLEADALKAAIKSGKVEFEVRVFSDKALGDPTQRSPAQAALMIIPNLEADIQAKMRRSSIWRDRADDVTVQRIRVADAYIKQAEQQLSQLKRLDVVPGVHQRASQMGLSTTDPVDLHRAWVTMMAEEPGQPHKFEAPAYDPKSGRIFDKDRAFHIESLEQSSVRSYKEVDKKAAEIMKIVSAPVHPPGGGPLAASFVILDTTQLPPTRVQALREALAALAKKQKSVPDLDRILVIRDSDRTLQPLIPKTAVAVSATTGVK